MKLLIIGSRSITDFDLSPYVSDEVDLIISGGAAGVDRLAEELADKRGISKLIIRPDYKKYSRAAPLIRNRAMVEAADKVIAVWDGASRGCLFSIRYAKGLGKPTLVLGMDGREIDPDK